MRLDALVDDLHQAPARQGQALTLLSHLHMPCVWFAWQHLLSQTKQTAHTRTTCQAQDILACLARAEAVDWQL